MTRVFPPLISIKHTIFVSHCVRRATALDLYYNLDGLLSFNLSLNVLHYLYPGADPIYCGGDETGGGRGRTGGARD